MSSAPRQNHRIAAVHPYFKVRGGQPVPRNRHHPNPAPIPNPVPPPPIDAWTVSKLCAAYNWPKNMPGRGYIGIVELGGGYHKSDVITAFAAAGLPVPNITDISVDGTTNNPGSDADGEVALDIQAAGIAFSEATGVAANIRMYWCRDMRVGLDRAHTDGCVVYSISWGADESQWGAAALEAMEASAKVATDAGTVVLAAAGDNDSSDGVPGAQANVDAPASCPHIIACGGTTLPVGNVGGDDETVWNDNPGSTNGQGTGGGFSTFFPPQSWQTGIPAPSGASGAGRMVPDIAANADPRTGIAVFLNGQWAIFGGTSFVAPLYAGLFASFEEHMGFITPELYANKLDFHDITLGNNGAYSARVGPDPCTGLGSPNAALIAETFNVPPAPAVA